MNIAQALLLGRTMGWRWAASRLGYAVKARSGHLRRRMPVKDWPARLLGPYLADEALSQPHRYLEHRRSGAPAFFFDPSRREEYRGRLASWDAQPLSGATPQALAGDAEAGILRCFGHAAVRTGFPPDWHADPFTGRKAPADRHWSGIDDFGHGDIKRIWEANRFGFAYDLVRAYWRTGDERHGETFWRLVADWKSANPPQAGVNWKCGQEISIRLMAWAFGLHGFISAGCTTPERVAGLAQMVAESADRIGKNIDYALDQRNNHGISEALGLWTAGLLFPEFRDAERWRETGRRHLEELAGELIYDDGSFVQHSFNYHRLMLQAYTWAVRLGELNGMPLGGRLRSRLRESCLFLHRVQDEATGRAPNYGHNDGSLILPLSNCDFRDYRPAVQSAHYLLTGERCFAEGPWDEELLWLFGEAALRAPVAEGKREDLRAAAGGYYTFRADAGSGFAFVRCGGHRHRPAQADMLHVDLWWRGVNVAQDPGTYSYNAPRPWDNALAGTAFHNTVTVDGKDQMDRAGRFLWLPWVTGSVRRMSESPSRFFLYWEGEHDGYGRLRHPASHVRGVLKVGEEHWLVVDRLESGGEHDYRLHWLLPDVPHAAGEERGSVALSTPAGPYRVSVGSACGEAALSVVRAEENGPRGWCSHYYMHKEPAVSVSAGVRGRGALFISLFGPEGHSWRHEGGVLDIMTGNRHISVDLNGLGADDGSPIVARARVSGASSERFEPV